jgi:hypothetical protein
MDESKDNTRNLPLLPIFGSLTIFYTVLLEVGMVIGNKLSGGKWPAPAKYWVVAAVALVAGIYKVMFNKHDKTYVRHLAHQPLAPRQILIVLCFLMGWVLLLVWMMMRPPGPEFRPA